MKYPSFACYYISLYFLWSRLAKTYLSISEGLCLLEESKRQQHAWALTQYKIIIVMKRIVKMIPTVTPTNISIWGDKCSEIKLKVMLVMAQNMKIPNIIFLEKYFWRVQSTKFWKSLCKRNIYLSKYYTRILKMTSIIAFDGLIK